MFEAMPNSREAVKLLIDAACEWLQSKGTEAARTFRTVRSAGTDGCPSISLSGPSLTTTPLPRLRAELAHLAYNASPSSITKFRPASSARFPQATSSLSFRRQRVRGLPTTLPRLLQPDLQLTYDLALPAMPERARQESQVSMTTP